MKVAVVDHWPCRRQRRLMPLPEEPQRISAYTLYFRNQSPWPTFLPPIVYGSIFIQIFVVDSKRRTCSTLECVSAVQGHPRTMILPFGVNRKHVCDFLLVRHCKVVLSCTVSEMRRLMAKNCVFPIPLSFGAPARYVPFGILWWK